MASHPSNSRRIPDSRTAIRIARYALAWAIVLTLIVVAWFQAVTLGIFLSICSLFIAVQTDLLETLLIVYNYAFRRKYVIRGVLQIYDRVEKMISQAEVSIRFITPTPSWGSYSAGDNVFEKAVTALSDKATRGLKVRVITEAFDWTRVPYVLALSDAGIPVRLSSESIAHRYFLVVDEKRAIEMATDAPADDARTVRFLGRCVRPLRPSATVLQNANDIMARAKEFDEQWSNLSNNVAEMLQELSVVECQHCKNPVSIDLRMQSRKLSSEEAALE